METANQAVLVLVLILYALLTTPVYVIEAISKAKPLILMGHAYRVSNNSRQNHWCFNYSMRVLSIA